MHFHPGFFGLKRRDCSRPYLAIHLRRAQRVSVNLEEPHYGNAEQALVFFQEGPDHLPVTFFKRAELTTVKLLLGNLPLWVTDEIDPPEASENKLPPG